MDGPEWLGEAVESRQGGVVCAVPSLVCMKEYMRLPCMASIAGSLSLSLSLPACPLPVARLVAGEIDSGGWHF